MFTSLPQFYNSPQWKALRNGLMNQRINSADGILYSEHSGKPIVRSYDIVAHHKIPLTMQNVNDYSISLNPENIIFVSQAEHNEIHSRFGYVTERKVYYVWGAPCSGKTSFVNSIKGNSDLVVDMDNIWQCITGGERYFKPNALKQNAFGLRDCLIDMVKKRAGKWEKAFIITTSAVKSIRTREIELYGAEDIYVNTDKAECLKRLYGDCNMTIEQKKELEQYINQWFMDFTE